MILHHQLYITAMTKREAETEFRAHHMPAIVEREARQSGGVDKPLRRQSWNDYTDMLCKGGQITHRQYSSWTHPRWLLSKRICRCYKDGYIAE
jgi:hypothetical protein